MRRRAPWCGASRARLPAAVRGCASGLRLEPSEAAEAVLRQGFAAPLRAVDAERAERCLGWLRDYGEACGGLAGDARFKTHLLLPWVADLVTSPSVLGPLKALLGEDILIWSSGWAIKPPGSSGYYSWHQDSTYAGVEPSDDVVVAWIALSRANPESGGLRYIPGSHDCQLPHVDRFEEQNLLSRGQHVESGCFDEASAVDVSLQPGEFALHHFRCVHGSGPNTTAEPRVGLQVLYMAARCRKPEGCARESAFLVCGEDLYGHWELEPRPVEAAGPREVAAHQRALALEKANYFADSRGRRGYHK